MLRFLAEENLNNNIVRDLRLRAPALDLVRVQDVGLIGVDDPAILAWAASAQRVVMTHDVSTMIRYAHDRVAAGRPMPGVVEVVVGARLATVIDDLILLATASRDGEWEGQVLYVPSGDVARNRRCRSQEEKVRGTPPAMSFNGAAAEQRRERHASYTEEFRRNRLGRASGGAAGRNERRRRLGNIGLVSRNHARSLQIERGERVRATNPHATARA